VLKEEEEKGSTSEEQEEETITCRICYMGPEAGKLISPCLCRGSIRYVHATCLHQWRNSAQTPNAFYECNMCKYRYCIRRALIAQILRSALILNILSFIIVGILVVITAFTLRAVDENFASRQMAKAVTPSFDELRSQSFVGDIGTKTIHLNPDVIDFLEKVFLSSWLWDLTGAHILMGVVGLGTLGWLFSFWLYAPLIMGQDRNWNWGILPILLLIGIFKICSIVFNIVKFISGVYLRGAENLIVEAGDPVRDTQDRISNEYKSETTS